MVTESGQNGVFFGQSAGLQGFAGVGFF